MKPQTEKESILKPELLPYIEQILEQDIPKTTPNIVKEWNEKHPLSRLSEPTMRKYLNHLADDKNSKVERKEVFGRHGFFLKK